MGLCSRESRNPDSDWEEQNNALEALKNRPGSRNNPNKNVIGALWGCIDTSTPQLMGEIMAS